MFIYYHLILHMLNFLSANPKTSKGRLFQELQDQPYRSPFERDRDRIIHSTAFRKLKQKTQVFIESESDYYRTRLTHTLEVSQITRSLCRTLKLNEDLGECIALAHDLGHPPYGHTGEKILNKKMINYGGFNHNEQTLRIITFLEKKYFNFDGLNLTWESLEGIIKHNGVFKNHIPVEIAKYNKLNDLNIDKNPSIEAQIASISDDIAYNNHDIDDSIRANLINIDDLYQMNHFYNIINKIYKKYKGINKSILLSEVIRLSIKLMVEDIIDKTIKNIEKNSINSIQDVYDYPNFLVSMSDKMKEECVDIKKFLYDKIYKNDKLENKRKISEKIISKLFDYYLSNFSLLPEDWKSKIEFTNKQKIICDYIAGMTDRYAALQYDLIND